MSLPLESSSPIATGMNIGSFDGWPGVGGTSWLQNIQFRGVFYHVLQQNKQKSNLETKFKYLYLNFKEKVRASALYKEETFTTGVPACEYLDFVSKHKQQPHEKKEFELGKYI